MTMTVKMAGNQRLASSGNGDNSPHPAHIHSSHSSNSHPRPHHHHHQSTRSLRHCLSALLLALVALINVNIVSASHFAYGSISYTYVSGNTYVFNFESAWRTDYQYPEGTACLTPTRSCSNVLTVGTLSFSSGARDINVKTNVQSIQPGDWFIGTTQYSVTFSSNPNGVTYNFNMCCRLNSIMQSNGGQNVVVQGSIGPSSVTKSIVATGTPRVWILQNQPVNFRVPAQPASDGLPLNYTFTDGKNSPLQNGLGDDTGLSYNPPAPDRRNPASPTLDQKSGVLSWTAPSLSGKNSDGDPYAIQFTIDNGNHFVVLDILFQVIAQCDPQTTGCSLPPYFNPPIPAQYVFYYGQPTTYVVRAVDDTTPNTLIIFTGLVPDGATLTPLTSSSNPSVATYAFKWAPQLGQATRPVCFTAQNNQPTPQQSLGNNCADLVIGQGQIIVVSTSIRDFSKNHPDFQVTAARDDGAQFVSSTLVNSGPPTFTTGVSSNVKNFASWFSDTYDTANGVTGPYGKVSWDMVLSSPQPYDWTKGGVQSGALPYTFQNFGNFFPIDGQLGGNEGDTHNRYFTLEAHTYISYYSGLTLDFYSDDDLWVFINGQLIPGNYVNNKWSNGWPLGGVSSSDLPSSPASTDTIRHVHADLDYLAKTYSNLNLVVDNAQHDHPMRVDFFYAQRAASSLQHGGLQMQLTPSFLCNALSTGGYVIFDQSSGWTMSSAKNSFALSGAASWGTSSLSLLSGSPPSVSSAVWYGSYDTTKQAVVPQPLKVEHGFEADFSFAFTGTSEGFAFVLQSSGPTAIGSEAGGLGYNGIARSLAFEFDGITESSQWGDLAESCPGVTGGCQSTVSIHYNGVNANSANEQYSLGWSSSVQVPLYMQFENKTVHNVKIIYSPPDATSGATAGWLKVYMGVAGYSPNLAPIAEAPINAADLHNTFGGSAFVGFTASSSDTYKSDITINNFKLTVVVPSAATSVPKTLPINFAAGTTGSFIVQLRDQCNNPMTSGGDAAQLAVSLSPAAPSLSAPSIVDNQDGTYLISYSPTKVNTYTVTVTYTAPGTSTAVNIKSAPWTFNVLPGAADPSTSTFEVDDTTGKASTTFFTGATNNVRITGNDKYGNLASLTVDVFSVAFTPTVNMGNQTSDAARGAGHYIQSWSVSASGIYSVAVTLGGVNIVDSPASITVKAGPAYAPKCTSSGSGLNSAIAGVPATFAIVLRDIGGNLVQPPNSDLACGASQTDCYLTYSGTPPGPPVVAPGAPKITCQWTTTAPVAYSCTFIAYTAGSYNFNVKINGVAMTAFPGSVSVVPNSVNGTTSTFGTSSTFQVTAGTPVSNLYIQARDSYYNPRQTPNDNGASFSVSIASSGSTPYTVTSPSSVPFSATNYQGNGQYLVAFTTTTAVKGQQIILTATYSADNTVSGKQLVDVVPGAADNKNSKTNPSPTGITDGVSSVGIGTASDGSTSPTGTFSILSYDANNNARYVPDKSPYSYTLVWKTQSGQTLPDFTYTLSSPDSTGYTYPVSFSYKTANNYSLSVQVTATGLDISGSPFNYLVYPDATSTANCVANGPGLQVAMVNIPTTFSILARDKFNNIQNIGKHQTDDVFYAVISTASTVYANAADKTGTTTALNAAVQVKSAGSGVYSLRYSTGLSTGTFTITLYRVENGGACCTGGKQFAQYTVTAQSNPANLYVKLSGPDSQQAQVGRVNTFTITEYTDASLTQPQPGSVSMIVNIQHSSGISIQGVSVSTGGPTDSQYTVTFTPALTLPASGTWSVVVMRGTTVATNQPSGFPYNIVPGSVAGGVILNLKQTYSASNSNATCLLELRDSYSNPVGQVSPAPVASWGQSSSQTGTPNGAQYSFSLPTIYMGTYVVTFSYNSQPEATGIYTVTSGPPSAAQSTYTTMPLTVTAGLPGPMTVTLKDAFGNVISDDIAATTTISASLPSGNSVNFKVTATYVGSGQYAVQLYNEKAGNQIPLSVSFTVNGGSPTTITSVSSSTSTMTTLPAALDPTRSSVYVQSPIPAGTAMTATVSAYDRFQNPITNAASLSAIARDPSLNSLPAPATLNSATYTFTVNPMYVTLAGNYNFEFISGGVSVVLTATPSSIPTNNVAGSIVQVVPGPVYPPNTLVPSSLGFGAVGAVVSFNITLRDQWFNVITQPSSQPTFAVNYLVGRSSCFDTDAHPVVSQTCSSTGVGCPAIQTVGSSASPFSPSSNGQYSMSFKANAIGTYTVNVTVNGQSLSCSAYTQLSVTVGAGAPDPTQSYITGLPSTAVANTPVTLTLTLRDSFGNLVGVGFGNSFVSYGTTNNGNSYALTSDDAKSPTDNGDGTYTLVVAPTHARSTWVNVIINGNSNSPVNCVSSAPKSNDGVVGFNCIYSILPADPWQWIIVQQSLNPRAGDPNYFLIQATDAYNNSATQTNITLSVSGVNNGIKTYVVPGALTSMGSQFPGQFRYDYFSVLSGTTLFTVGLSPSKSSYCVNVNPNSPYLCPDKSCVGNAFSCSQPPKTGVLNINLLSATCGSTSSTPFRCLDGTCASDATKCPEFNGAACGPTQVRSSIDGACYASNALPCPNGLTRCAQTGVCAPANSCAVPQPCPVGTSKCPAPLDGYCRADTNSCPSLRVCPPNLVMCPDSLTCVPSKASCPDAFTSGATCPVGQTMCWNGKCATQFEDCPTPKSCPNGAVVCPDGSCQSSALNCAPVYPCYNSTFTGATSVSCWDGSCRSSFSDCPSQTSCPAGYTLCESGVCAASLSSCPAVTECPPSQVRCGDGSCKANIYFCSTKQSCPASAPVQCSDGSCTTSINLCSQPASCSSGQFQCSDGSCAANSAQCPTVTTCPFSDPVLCPDGSCAQNSALCATRTPPACSLSLPIRCPDGSCRASLQDCPSRAACIDSRRPVRCGDGRCVESLQMCQPASLVQCPPKLDSNGSPVYSGGVPVLQVRCPFGGCASSYSACPTPITCPIGSVRCNDGSCRASCDATSELMTCSAPNLVRCPVPTGGLVCTTNAAQCPTFPVCPASTPVRCLDMTCASSVNNCPPLPATSPGASHTPCPDGSWASSAASCATPVTCPVTFPYKCWDETCRKAPADCPVAPTCPTTQPYRCQSGVCAVSPWDLSCIHDQYNCMADKNGPVRCPGTSTYANGICSPSVGQCVSSSPSQLIDCPGGLTPNLNPATVNERRCRDGSCRYGFGAKQGTTIVGVCDDAKLQCPSNFPVLCDGGFCALSLSACPNNTQGLTNTEIGVTCPANYYFCPSTGGTCLPLPLSLAACPALSNSAAACPAAGLVTGTQSTVAGGWYSGGTARCVDGSCAPSADQCPDRQPSCAVRCLDGSCSAKFDSCSTGTDQGPGMFNTCPFSSPYKCPNGFCALSSVLCPNLPDFGVCKGAYPVQCANGKCVQDVSQCPVIRPCDSSRNEVRCPDGTCRQSGQCPQANTCPPVNGNMFRCANGLCSIDGTPTGCLCTDTSNGCTDANSCPIGYSKCTQGKIGACVQDVNTCGNNTNTNGCGISTPVKCPDGSCQASASSCTQANGCPASAPIRCTSGTNPSYACVQSISQCVPASNTGVQCANGEYAASASSCKALNGCPLSTPVRCFNGDCRKFPSSALGLVSDSSQVCPPTSGCAQSSSFLCFDGSCVADLSLCPTAVACSAGKVPCSDGSCASSSASCPSKCPSAAPVLCLDGSCQASLSACPKPTSIGTGTGGASGSSQTGAGSVTQAQPCAGCTSTPPGPGFSGGGPIPAGGTQSPPAGQGIGQASSSTQQSRCASPLTECYDGSCRETPSDCITWSKQVNSATCESSGLVTCYDGSCQPSVSVCKVIPACPSSRPVRCPDGACIAGTDNSQCASISKLKCSWNSGFTPSQTYRCEDGTCRPQCLPFDGCPVWMPVHCGNRECAARASDCSKNANGGPFQYDVQLTLPRDKAGHLPSTPSSTISSQSRVIPVLASNRHLLNYDDELIFTPLATSLTGSSSSTGSASSTSSSTGSSSGTGTQTTTGPCYVNCYSQIKATPNQYVITKGIHQQIDFVTDGATVLGMLDVPGTYPNANSTTATVTIAPVAESRVRRAENRIWSAKRYLFKGLEFLTFAESVISPMVEITLDPTVVTPLTNGNITIRLGIDRTWLGNTADNSNVCLATLVENTPTLWSAWQCINTAVSSTRAGDPQFILEGSFGQNGVYAMIYSPSYVAVAGTTISWALENVGWLILILIGGIGFVFGVLYSITRLVRYRKKYHEERAAVQKQTQEVEDMEQFGGAAGTKDDEVEMQSNPMVVQMKDMQARLDKKEQEMRSAEQEQRVQASAVRQDHINALKSDRDSMMAELERLKAELASQAKAGPAGPKHADMGLPPSAGNTYSNYNTASRPQAQYDMGPAVPQGGRQEFQSSRPKARRGID